VCDRSRIGAKPAFGPGPTRTTFAVVAERPSGAVTVSRSTLVPVRDGLYVTVRVDGWLPFGSVHA